MNFSFKQQKFRFVLLLAGIFTLTATYISGSETAKQPQPQFVGKILDPTVAPLQTITQVPLPQTLTFAGERIPLEDPEVKERFDRELTLIVHQHSTTIRILKLANRWFPEIESTLRANGIPDDFKYLAVAESGLENVTSPSDAKGFWEFLAATARSYGLEVNAEVDERLHLEKSTQAACQYLQGAFNKFGNWTIAAAAYNRGVEGVQKNMNEQFQYDFYKLYLNLETARYVFRIAAYKQFIENAANYGYVFDQTDLYPPLATRVISVDKIDDGFTFATSFGTTYRQLRILNPWMREPYLRTKPGKMYYIKLPL